MSRSSCSLGMRPASLFFVALTITMTRIVFSVVRARLLASLLTGRRTRPGRIDTPLELFSTTQKFQPFQLVKGLSPKGRLGASTNRRGRRRAALRLVDRAHDA